jgi:hypothetical protein
MRSKLRSAITIAVAYLATSSAILVVVLGLSALAICFLVWEISSIFSPLGSMPQIVLPLPAGNPAQPLFEQAATRSVLAKYPLGTPAAPLVDELNRERFADRVYTPPDRNQPVRVIKHTSCFRRFRDHICVVWSEDESHELLKLSVQYGEPPS